MGYSRKRLFLIGVLWISVGLLLFGTSIIASTGAQESDSCPNEEGPCPWPAQNYDGGITLGTTVLDGQEVALFDPDSIEDDGFSIDDSYDSEQGLETSFPLSEGASSMPGGADVVTIGFDVDAVNSLFLHKTWKTQAGSRFAPTDAQMDDQDNWDDVYIYIETTEARLQGPSGDDGSPDVDGVECREPDDNDEFNPDHCDLVAEVAEVSFNDVIFEADVDTALGTATVTDDQIDGISEDEDDGYWVTRPQEDVCGFLSIFTFDFTQWPPANIDGFCLSVIDPTFDEDVPTADDVDIQELVFFDLQVRGHGFAATPPQDDVAQSNADNPQELNKDLILGNPNDPDSGFYAEIRWGKGEDRALFPPSLVAGDADREEGEIGDPDTHRFGGPTPRFSDSSIRTGPQVAGSGNTFQCIGNPTGVGAEGCEQPDEYSGDPQPGAYDDVCEQTSC